MWTQTVESKTPLMLRGTNPAPLSSVDAAMGDRPLHLEPAEPFAAKVEALVGRPLDKEDACALNDFAAEKNAKKLLNSNGEKERHVQDALAHFAANVILSGNNAMRLGANEIATMMNIARHCANNAADQAQSGPCDVSKSLEVTMNKLAQQLHYHIHHAECERKKRDDRMRKNAHAGLHCAHIAEAVEHHLGLC